MPVLAISLNGEWELTGKDPRGEQRPIRIPGRVPGQVHLDLLSENLLPDPFWRENAERVQWVESWDWTYARDFEVPEDFPLDWVVLTFEGLDTFASVRLNGGEIGQTANMFISHAFEVGKMLRRGRNTLEVAFTPPSVALEGKSIEGLFGCFSRDRLHARKMQCAFGWDWVHRFVTAGLWRPVTLQSFTGARMDELFIYTLGMDANGANLHVSFTAEKRTSGAVTAHVEVLDPEQNRITSRVLDVDAGQHVMEVTVEDPELWWPNGMGGQPLYTCVVTLHDATGATLDEKIAAFGIRTVLLEETPDAMGSSFVIRVNDRRVFCKGGNWVPADPFPAGITPERYERLISMARDGNVNMLRVWGGGIYEPEAFWNACDAAGILIMQDFMLACADYPETDEDFLGQLRVEFAQVIKAMRNHPSLVFWSGNNELGMNSEPDSMFSGRKISEEITGPLCAALDPSRPFWLTSPYKGKINNSPEMGDCHLSGWYNPEFFRSDMRDYRQRAWNTWGRFMSEYAAPGAPPMRSLLKFMTPDDVVDPRRLMWEYHTKDNPYSGMSDFTSFTALEATARTIYGDTDNPTAHVRHMEYLQCEWIRLASESARRHKFDCAGILFWMFNNCWPASGWAVLDYDGFAKAGYHGMRRAFQPIIAALEPVEDGSVNLWVCNDSLEPVKGTLDLRFQPWTGASTWHKQLPFSAPANASIRVTQIPRKDIRRDGMLVCDLASPANDDRALYYDGLPRDMALPTALLKVVKKGGGRHGAITISSHCYARVVTLEADLDFSDNYFDLMPGEERTIQWSCPQGVFVGDISVICWNGQQTP